MTSQRVMAYIYWMHYIICISDKLGMRQGCNTHPGVERRRTESYLNTINEMKTAAMIQQNKYV